MQIFEIAHTSKTFHDNSLGLLTLFHLIPTDCFTCIKNDKSHLHATSETIESLTSLSLHSLLEFVNHHISQCLTSPCNPSINSNDCSPCVLHHPHPYYQHQLLICQICMDLYNHRCSCTDMYTIKFNYLLLYDKIFN